MIAMKNCFFFSNLIAKITEASINKDKAKTLNTYKMSIDEVSVRKIPPDKSNPTKEDENKDRSLFEAIKREIITPIIERTSVIEVNFSNLFKGRISFNCYSIISFYGFFTNNTYFFSSRFVFTF
jgi:hypothetical protein